MANAAGHTYSLAHHIQVRLQKSHIGLDIQQSFYIDASSKVMGGVLGYEQLGVAY
jgi:hypothetical protein